MPRRLRTQEAGVLHHLVCKGNGFRPLFADDADYSKYLSLLEEARKLFPIKIFNYVLMEDHLQLLVKPIEEGALSKFMEYVSKNYVKYYNKARNQSGTLFQGRYKAFIVQDETNFFTCLRYIDVTPVAKKVIDSPQNYQWSGHLSLAYGKGEGLKLDKHELYLNIGTDAQEQQIVYRALILNTQGEQLDFINKRAGVLGDKEFKGKHKSK